MGTERDRAERTLARAEEIYTLLADQGIEVAVIGGVALAVHGYQRGTEDFDLGVVIAEPSIDFRKIKALLPDDLDSSYVLPDDYDSLGGVMTIVGEDIDPIQLVNFFNQGNLTSGTPGIQAVKKAAAGLIEESPLRVVDLPHLIALKLYAGGLRGKADVLDLLQRNEDADLNQIRAVCARFSLEKQLDEVLEEAK